MRKRIRNPDKYRVGRSSLVPYLENESWKERHRRRISEALKNEQEVQLWCENNGWRLYIKNNGHHWLFVTKAKKTVEWWPSSGKLVIGKSWKQGIHCHDYKQLLKVLEMML